jgi:hypothetical protein
MFSWPMAVASFASRETPTVSPLGKNGFGSGSPHTAARARWASAPKSCWSRKKITFHDQPADAGRPRHPVPGEPVAIPLPVEGETDVDASYAVVLLKALHDGSGGGFLVVVGQQGDVPVVDPHQQGIGSPSEEVELSSHQSKAERHPPFVR